MWCIVLHHDNRTGVVLFGHKKTDIVSVDRFADNLERFMGGIVGFAQMAQNDIPQIHRHHGTQQGFGGIIGKMAIATFYSLLQRPGVGSVYQHIEVVIGFKNEKMAASQMLPHKPCRNAEICCDADSTAIHVDGESDRIDGIVGDIEGMDDKGGGEGTAFRPGSKKIAAAFPRKRGRHMPFRLTCKPAAYSAVLKPPRLEYGRYVRVRR